MTIIEGSFTPIRLQIGAALMILSHTPSLLGGKVGGSKLGGVGGWVGDSLTTALAPVQPTNSIRLLTCLLIKRDLSMI